MYAKLLDSVAEVVATLDRHGHSWTFERREPRKSTGGPSQSVASCVL
ncbi:MAG TPA: hypothetical protein VGY54_14140 [Polyangiaceae bacterium]|nr:hypothetical protein [Polyangiaceae bacterium]